MSYNYKNIFAGRAETELKTISKNYQGDVFKAHAIPCSSHFSQKDNTFNLFQADIHGDTKQNWSEMG